MLLDMSSVDGVVHIECSVWIRVKSKRIDRLFVHCRSPLALEMVVQ